MLCACANVKYEEWHNKNWAKNIVVLLLYLRNIFIISLFNSEATMITATGQHVPQKRYPEDCIEGYCAQEIATVTVDPEPRAPVTLYNLLETLQVTWTLFKRVKICLLSAHNAYTRYRRHRTVLNWPRRHSSVLNFLWAQHLLTVTGQQVRLGYMASTHLLQQA